MNVPPPPFRALAALSIAFLLLTLADVAHWLPRGVVGVLYMLHIAGASYLAGVIWERGKRFKDAMRHQDELLRLLEAMSEELAQRGNHDRS